MEDWESIQKYHERACESRIQREMEMFWHKSIADATGHFKRHIAQQVERGLEEYTAALRRLSSNVSDAGVQDIMPNETVMISILVGGLTRQLQQKYFHRSVEPRPSHKLTAPAAFDAISIQDESDPPTPESISAWGLPLQTSVVKEDSAARQQNSHALSQDNSMSEQVREDSQTVAPTTSQGEISRTGQGQNKRPIETIDPDLPRASLMRASKRARQNNPKLFSGTIENEPTNLGSIHCSEVEGQDHIFAHEAFPGYFFVIRCDREYNRSGISYKFPLSPIGTYNRAFRHFKREKPRERCHDEDLCGDYTDIEIIVKFGYRVYGDDLGEEGWIATSNEKASSTATKSKALNAPDEARSRARLKEKGKGKEAERIINGGQAASRRRSAASTVPGPSNTGPVRRRGPELGPARR
ncbi:hypothetical protein V8F20_002329 [Naviculisporaceae sp. PSN 640]